jgi:outer membrane lipoprotein-sorting protein
MAQQKTNRKKWLWLILILIVLVILVYLYYNFSDNDEADVSKEALDTYLEANTKHGYFDVESFDYDGKEEDPQTGEFWVKGDQFRIDYYYQSGEKRISIISGEEKPYFCYPDKESCQPAVASLKHYLIKYQKPDPAAQDLGYDSKLDCDKYKYEINRTYDIKGSSNTWYDKDLVYCVSGSEIKQVESQGTYSREVGFEKTTQKLKDLQFGMDISDDVFELPYEIKNVDR